MQIYTKCILFKQTNNKRLQKETLIDNYQKILIAMNPVIPHFSSECLSMLNIKKIKWPNYDLSLFKDDKVNIVIQINGKKEV